MDKRQFTSQSWYSLIEFTEGKICCLIQGRDMTFSCIVITKDGPKTAKEGDWILKDTDGNLYLSKEGKYDV